MTCRSAGLFWLLAALLAAAAVPARADDAPPPARGLDALGDDALMNELATRGLSTLLQRAFDVDHVPPDQRKARLMLVAMGELDRPDLTDRQRQALIDAVVKGVDESLPRLLDPQALYRAGSQLDSASRPDVAMLEYWGANPSVQGMLRPLAEVQIKLWDRCHALADKAAEVISNEITSPDDTANIKRYQDLKSISQYALYRKGFAQYAQALGIDKADPQRVTVAQAAAATLKQFDNAEQAAIRPQTRITLGKLAALAGDFPAARQALESVADAAKGDFPQAPKPEEQYQARYFRAVTDLDARDPDAARKSADDLAAWLVQQPALAQSSSVQAAAAVLEYRIHNLRAELAADAGTRRSETDAAVAVMEDLLGKQPNLRPVVYRLLAANVPHDADLTQADNLVYQALVWQADISRGRTDLDDQDRQALERGVTAADMLVNRAAHPGTGTAPDPTVAADAMLVKALVLEKLGRNGQAANALLDYVEKNLAAEKAAGAMAEAQKLIGDARAKNPDDPEIQQAYRRFLPMAIGPPFNQTVFAFEYGRLLQSQGKLNDAMAAYQKVPADDHRALLAKYFDMLTSSQSLQELKPDDPQRVALLASVQRLADEIGPDAQAAEAAATDDRARTTARTVLVGTRLAAADLALRQQNQPQRAIDLLAGLEPQVAALPDAGARLSQMLLIRVQAYMAMGKYSQSTDELVKLAKDDQQHAGQIVFDMLQSLNDQLEKAQVAGDADRVRDAARNRSQLTGFLVDWAKKNPNERIKKYTYGYSVFDAEVQRFAAVQETDPTARAVGLQRALARFTALDTPAAFEQYKATRTPEQLEREQPHYDPAVRLGLARVQFDLGHWDQARQAFLDLLNDRQIGAAVKYAATDSAVDAGQLQAIDNNDYWEAVYKLVVSVQKLNDPAELDKAKGYLKRQYVQWGPRVGGTKWKSEFQQLHDQLIPDLDLSQFGVPAPATRPAA